MVTMRAGLAVVAIILLAACHTPGSRRAHAAVPAGWVAIPPPQPQGPDAYCANWADTAWQVSFTHDSGRLVFRPQHYGPMSFSVSVPGGRLGADNRGEFGGSIWWQPDDSSEISLGPANLLAFVPMPHELLGLEGLAHMGTNYGRVLRFVRRADGWRVDTILQLGEAPSAYTLVPPDSLFVVTTGHLLVIHGSTVRPVYETRLWWLTAPSSLVRDPSGDVYIGMRWGVAHLTPSGATYTEQWLVPAACPARRKIPGELSRCACVGAR